MGVKIITYPKFIISICLIHFLSNNVKRSQMWASYRSKFWKLPGYVSLDYWPFLDFVSAILLPTDEPTINAFKVRCFSQAKGPLAHLQQALSMDAILFLARHKTGTNFSQHSANYKALRTQPKLASRLLKLRNFVNGKL